MRQSSSSSWPSSSSLSPSGVHSQCANARTRARLNAAHSAVFGLAARARSPRFIKFLTRDARHVQIFSRARTRLRAVAEFASGRNPRIARGPDSAKSRAGVAGTFPAAGIPRHRRCDLTKQRHAGRNPCTLNPWPAASVSAIRSG
jgi:hypothetical protein